MRSQRIGHGFESHYLHQTAYKGASCALFACRGLGHVGLSTLPSPAHLKVHNLQPFSAVWTDEVWGSNPRGREALSEHACGMFVAERYEQSAIASTAVLKIRTSPTVSNNRNLKRTTFVLGFLFAVFPRSVIVRHIVKRAGNSFVRSAFGFGCRHSVIEITFVKALIFALKYVTLIMRNNSYGPIEEYGFFISIIFILHAQTEFGKNANSAYVCVGVSFRTT